MKFFQHCALLLFINIAFSLSASALPQGSLDRCKSDDWAHIDDILPPRSQNGGYEHPLDPATQKIEKLNPEQILQSMVNHLLTFYDLCGQKVAGVGGWEDLIGTNMCERLALYDITHEGILSSIEPPKKGKGEMVFSDSDLRFVRSVFKACRPTTQRWWNYPLIVHVSFKPTPQEYARVGNVLKGLNSFVAPVK